MLSGEPAVDTGPKPVPLQCEVLYVDSDCCTHPPGTGQAEPLISLPTRPAQGRLNP